MSDQKDDQDLKVSLEDHVAAFDDAAARIEQAITLLSGPEAACAVRALRDVRQQLDSGMRAAVRAAIAALAPLGSAMECLREASKARDESLGKPLAGGQDRSDQELPTQLDEALLKTAKQIVDHGFTRIKPHLRQARIRLVAVLLDARHAPLTVGELCRLLPEMTPQNLQSQITSLGKQYYRPRILKDAAGVSYQLRAEQPQDSAGQRYAIRKVEAKTA